ncbi:hypothetical protein NK718_12750 [Alsobacter sp. SYSU M60028]|uniref:Uncharacterized protein n=1 Tax=Alsobacter ponti TaxID=2962936 RepID=A0ABT1LE45_9HYPH|nr:hypothetical protein [Alsobacter ponti]MCP8939386.1 hypothetical protein [Alsobacter ponti]
MSVDPCVANGSLGKMLDVSDLIAETTDLVRAMNVTAEHLPDDDVSPVIAIGGVVLQKLHEAAEILKSFQKEAMRTD